jgi:hypothetical protein
MLTWFRFGFIALSHGDSLLGFQAAESAREINDEADEQNQAKAAAADDGTPKVKSAAAEQEKQNNHE